ncbi:protein-PII uridylyltransferase [Vibrio sp. Y2-5]|uniref:protein-PII uridylyltransferase n=1 Tax=Vibrio sp. Y2-5 TaxID=2743977 RepID=UPI001660FB9A|nr:protein-PII uridylyltransferase [Vibrio sp. Y2-5]MBD0786381.1 protein-PII uridylyltransferase [Vibrio sp. Y2-5]
MPINYLYIDDEESKTLQLLIESIEFESQDKIKIQHTQVMESMKALVGYIQEQEGKFQGLIIDQDLKAESSEGHKADYFGTALAQQLRTEMAVTNLNSMPIVLLSNEEVIVESFLPDDASKNLFDFVIKKKEIAIPEIKARVSKMLIALVEAYNLARGYRKPLGVDLDKVEVQGLLQCNSVVFKFVDSRFIDFLSSKASDPHALVGSIYSSLIQSAGILVTEVMLKTKLGVSNDSEGWEVLKKEFEPYLYLGPFSGLKERWWFAGIDNWWFDIHEEDVLQSLTCEERVAILIEHFGISGLEPIATRYPNGDQSMNLWVNCVVSGVPLDPYDALRVRDSDSKIWEQPKYIDLITYLNGETDKYVIHADDKKKIRNLLKRLNPDVNG